MPIDIAVVGKWVDLVRLPKAKRRKTHIYNIRNRRYGFNLGEIKWHPNFRKFCFFPDPYTVWDQECLADVLTFLNYSTENRKDESG